MSRQNNEVKEIENWEDFQIAVKLYDRVHDEKLEKLTGKRVAKNWRAKRAARLAVEREYGSIRTVMDIGRHLLFQQGEIYKDLFQNFNAQLEILSEASRIMGVPIDSDLVTVMRKRIDPLAYEATDRIDINDVSIEVAMEAYTTLVGLLSTVKVNKHKVNATARVSAKSSICDYDFSGALPGWVGVPVGGEGNIITASYAQALANITSNQKSAVRNGIDFLLESENDPVVTAETYVTEALCEAFGEIYGAITHMYQNGLDLDDTMLGDSGMTLRNALRTVVTWSGVCAGFDEGDVVDYLHDDDGNLNRDLFADALANSNGDRYQPTDAQRESAYTVNLGYEQRSAGAMLGKILDQATFPLIDNQEE